MPNYPNFAANYPATNTPDWYTPDVARRFPILNRVYGGPPASAPSSPAVSHGVSDLPYLGQLAGGVNTINIGQQEQAVPGMTGNTAALTSEIHRLLNPADPAANADVTQHGAENAFARGTVGSPVAGETTGRARELDVERRAALGNQLLSGQANRAPAPFDVSRMILTPAQFGQLDLEQQRVYLDWYKAITGQHYGGGGGSGSGAGSGYGGGSGSRPISGTVRPPMPMSPLSLPKPGGTMETSSRYPGDEPSPDAGFDEWAAYYANLPYDSDPTSGAQPFEGIDYSPPPMDDDEYLYA